MCLNSMKSDHSCRRKPASRGYGLACADEHSTWPATLLIAAVTVGIVGYSIWVVRQTRKREHEIAAATRAELTALTALAVK